MRYAMDVGYLKELGLQVTPKVTIEKDVTFFCH